MTRRDPREYKKKRVRNVTRIRQQIGLEETIIKGMEKNQLTWYGRVQRTAEGRLPKNNTEVDAETKERTRKTEEKLD